MNTILDDSFQPPVIKVIGIGGGGINAINCMIENGIPGAEFIAIDSDTQELARSNKTVQRLHLSCKQEMPPARLIVTISDEGREHLKALIAGTDIVFIVAGMGSNTGTSIAPIAAEIARDMDILTIAVVSTPFLFEGNRQRRANQGIQELSEHADTLIVIPNAKILTKADMRISDAFFAATHLMHMAVTGIAESVSDKNLICLNIDDLRMIFADAGMVAMGMSRESGAGRAKVACERAISGIVPSTINWADARSILLNITASSALKLREVAEIMELVQDSAIGATVIAVAAINETMGDDLRVTLFATSHAKIPGSSPHQTDTFETTTQSVLDARKAP